MPDSIHSGHRERIREQYKKGGAETFPDHQFLELLLTYAIPRRDTNELAHALLERFGSLEGVVTAEIGVVQRWFENDLDENPETMARIMTVIAFVRPGDLYGQPIDINVPAYGMKLMNLRLEDTVEQD